MYIIGKYSWSHYGLNLYLEQTVKSNKLGMVESYLNERDKNVNRPLLVTSTWELQGGILEELGNKVTL